MKPTKLILVFFSILLIFTSCTKTTDVVISSEKKVVNFLTGSGNRIWNLTNMYENSLETVLTQNQRKNTKTYTVNPSSPAETYVGTLNTTDFGSGSWMLKGPANLIEVVQKNSVSTEIKFLINEISDTKLDIEYTQNYKTMRYVYVAY